MITLITTTLNREIEFNKFCESLLCQSVKFQFIIIDQNDQISRYAELWHDKLKNNGFDCLLIKTSRISLSKARNIGLKYSKFKIVGFPDDDCVYPNVLLKNVLDIFKANNSFKLIAFKSTSSKYKIDNIEKKISKKIYSQFELLGNLISYTCFFNFDNINFISFDERLGVGCYFSSAEETDFSYRFLLLNECKKFISIQNTFIFHPNKDKLFNINREKGYALGLGAFAKKNISFNIYYFYYYLLLPIIIKPLLFVLFSILTFSSNTLKISFTRFIYRIFGFIKFKNNE